MAAQTQRLDIHVGVGSSITEGDPVVDSEEGGGVPMATPNAVRPPYRVDLPAEPGGSTVAICHAGTAVEYRTSVPSLTYLAFMVGTATLTEWCHPTTVKAGSAEAHRRDVAAAVAAHRPASVGPDSRSRR